MVLKNINLFTARIEMMDELCVFFCLHCFTARFRLTPTHSLVISSMKNSKLLSSFGALEVGKRS